MITASRSAETRYSHAAQTLNLILSPFGLESKNAFKNLVADCVAGEWLFTNREGEQMKAIKKGFTAACRRAEIADLRPYDLRHTFATRLLERGVHHYVISALLGHSTPVVGGGFGSRMTPGYAHVSWEAMVRAVETLERPILSNRRIFVLDSGKIPANPEKVQKAG